MLQAQNNHREAIGLFEKILSSGLQGPQADRYRLSATLGKAVSLARAGQGEQALKLVENVVKSAEKGDTEIHARAYNALGECYLAMQDPKAALLAYLHVDALYNQHPPLHAEALANIANLWEQMEKTDRMQSTRKRLLQQYPNSKWAKG